jgi:hypothetical protein
VIRPFALSSAAQFRPSPPPPVDSAQARADMAEVRAFGAQTSRTRSAEQSEIARFWYEASDQGWNRIAREVAAAHHLDAWDSARLLALVNVAIADSIIGGVEAKYHYNYWRPVTAIRAAGDTEWLSDLVTPAVPDYPSTHTVQGAAVAAVLSRFFETDFVSFSMTSGDPYPGITRRFWSFSEAARENGASRVLAGIHFTSDSGAHVSADRGVLCCRHRADQQAASDAAASRERRGPHLPRTGQGHAGRVCARRGGRPAILGTAA